MGKAERLQQTELYKPGGGGWGGTGPRNRVKALPPGCVQDSRNIALMD